VPKVVWFVWLQGLGEAPEIVRLCLESWRRCNPGWELRALGRADLDGLIDLSAIPEAALGSASFQTLSDIARVRLLAAHGGVWADATTFCRRPLDGWLWSELGGGLFAFTAPGRDRLISTWFLAPSPGGPLIRALDAAVVRYWSGPSFQNERRPRLLRRLSRAPAALQARPPRSRRRARDRRRAGRTDRLSWGGPIGGHRLRAKERPPGRLPRGPAGHLLG
jgi:hypothetical protein